MEQNISPQDLKEAVNNADSHLPKNNKVKPTIDELLNSRITKDTIIPPLQPTITIRQGEKEYIIACKGDISFISGKAKVGKSTVVSTIIASAISPNQEDDFFGFSAKTEKIAYLDTEQSQSILGLMRDKICKYGSVRELPDNVLIIPLLEYDVLMRIALIEDLIRAKREEFEGCDVWFIDGLGDLLDNSNDPVESKKVIDRLRRLASECNTSIVILYHENPSLQNEKMQGHAGTKAEQKCGTVIRIKKDKQTQIHSIASHLSRYGGDFEEVLFKWSESQGRMVSLEGEEKDKAQQAIQAQNENKKKQYEKIKAFFSARNFEPVRATDYINNLKELFGVGESTAKTYTKNQIEWGFLEKIEETAKKVFYKFIENSSMSNEPEEEEYTLAGNSTKIVPF